MTVLIASVIVLVIVVVLTWPARYHDISGNRVFEGEVWGDLTTEGEIWGECDSDLEYVSVRHWSRDGGTGLRAYVSNVSHIWLFSYRTDTNVSIPCDDESFMIIADNGSFGAYLSNVKFWCEYEDFSGTFPGDEDDYYPDYNVSSIEGYGHVVHGQYHRYDITLNDCIILVNGSYHQDIDSIFVPEDENPLMEVEGQVGPEGSFRVFSALHPRVNGTVEVEDFLLTMPGRPSRSYDVIRFEGEDIYIRHNGGSQYGTGGPWAWFDQWSIEVTLSDDATVEVERAPGTPLWVEVVLLAMISALLVAIIRTWQSMRRIDDS